MVYLLVEGLAEEISMTKVFIDRPAELRGPTGGTTVPRGQWGWEAIATLGLKGAEEERFSQKPEICATLVEAHPIKPDQSIKDKNKNAVICPPPILWVPASVFHWLISVGKQEEDQRYLEHIIDRGPPPRTQSGEESEERKEKNR